MIRVVSHPEPQGAKVSIGKKTIRRDPLENKSSSIVGASVNLGNVTINHGSTKSVSTSVAGARVNVGNVTVNTSSSSNASISATGVGLNVANLNVNTAPSVNASLSVTAIGELNAANVSVNTAPSASASIHVGPSLDVFNVNVAPLSISAGITAGSLSAFNLSVGGISAHLDLNPINWFTNIGIGLGLPGGSRGGAKEGMQGEKGSASGSSGGHPPTGQPGKQNTNGVPGQPSGTLEQHPSSLGHNQDGTAAGQKAQSIPGQSGQPGGTSGMHANAQNLTHGGQPHHVHTVGQNPHSSQNHYNSDPSQSSNHANPHHAHAEESHQHSGQGFLTNHNYEISGLSEQTHESQQLSHSGQNQGNKASSSEGDLSLNPTQEGNSDHPTSSSAHENTSLHSNGHGNGHASNANHNKLGEARPLEDHHNRDHLSASGDAHNNSKSSGIGNNLEQDLQAQSHVESLNDLNTQAKGLSEQNLKNSSLVSPTDDLSPGDLVALEEMQMEQAMQNSRSSHVTTEDNSRLEQSLHQITDILSQGHLVLRILIKSEEQEYHGLIIGRGSNVLILNLRELHESLAFTQRRVPLNYFLSSLGIILNSNSDHGLRMNAIRTIFNPPGHELFDPHHLKITGFPVLLKSCDPLVQRLITAGILSFDETESPRSHASQEQDEGETSGAALEVDDEHAEVLGLVSDLLDAQGIEGLSPEILSGAYHEVDQENVENELQKEDQEEAELCAFCKPRGRPCCLPCILGGGSTKKLVNLGIGGNIHGFAP